MKISEHNKIAEGKHIQYDFVKPTWLWGETPADAAGVGVNAKNRWLGYSNKL